jgi:hypothetical protein
VSEASLGPFFGGKGKSVIVNGHLPHFCSFSLF